MCSRASSSWATSSGNRPPRTASPPCSFHGQLTLELKNILQHHRLALRPGMRIGQIVFLRHADAGERSYRLKGRYGGQTGVQPSKGVA